MTLFSTYDEFINVVKSIKNDYQGTKGESIKLNAAGLFTMVMGGVFDSTVKEQPVSLSTRFKMMDMLRSALKTKASTSKSRDSSILPIDEIDSELTRLMWLSQVNPAFVFRISDQYTEAMKVMGYVDTGAPNMKYRNQCEDIFTNFRALFSERALTYYGNRNVDRVPGIIAIYRGYQTISYGEGKKMMRVALYDGSTEESGVVWSKYNTNDEFDPGVVNALKSYRNKVCIVLGKVSRSSRGYPSFAIRNMRLIG